MEGDTHTVTRRFPVLSSQKEGKGTLVTITNDDDDDVISAIKVDHSLPEQFLLFLQVAMKSHHQV